MPNLRRPRRRRERASARTAERASAPRRKAQEDSPSPLRRVGYDARAILGELVGIPARAWMSAAEWAGTVVLAAARLAWPPIRAVWRLFLKGVDWGSRVVTPARMTALVALCAAVGLIASQFVDYRAVQVGQPQYEAVESIAPAALGCRP